MTPRSQIEQPRASRTRRFLAGAGLGCVYQALVMVAGLWLTPFLLQRLGQKEYGLWLVGTQLLMYLTLMDFGLPTLLLREMAYVAGRGSDSGKATDLASLVGQTARLVLWQSSFVFLAAAIFWFYLPAEWASLREPLGLVMLALAVLFPLRIFPVLLQGLHDFGFGAVVQIAAWFLSAALSVVLVMAGFGLYALSVGWITFQLLSSAACWHRLRSRFPAVLPARLPALRWTAARAQLGRGFWVSLAQIAHVLLNGTELVILAKLIGPGAVVAYACTGKLAGVLGNHSQVVLQAALPGLSELKAGEGRHRLCGVSTALSQGMLLLSGTVACIVLAINEGFVSWWVGKEQYAGFALTALILVNMVLRHWNTTLVYSLFALGCERRISLTSLLDGLVSLVGCLWLVWHLGALGAPLGLILGVCLVSLPLNLGALAREFGTHKSTLVKPHGPWFWRFSLLSFGTALAVTQVWMPTSFPEFAAAAGAMALLYLLYMWTTLERSPLGDYLLPYTLALKVRFSQAVGSQAVR